MRSSVLKAAVDAAHVEKGLVSGAKGLVREGLRMRANYLDRKEITADRKAGLNMRGAKRYHEMADNTRGLMSGLARTRAVALEGHAYNFSDKAYNLGRKSERTYRRIEQLKKSMIRGGSSKLLRNVRAAADAAKAADAKEPWRGRTDTSRLDRAAAVLARRYKGGPSRGFKPNAPKRGEGVYKGKRRAWDLLDSGNKAAGRTGGAVGVGRAKTAPLGTYADHYGRPMMSTAAGSARAASFVAQARRLARQLGVKRKP